MMETLLNFSGGIDSTWCLFHYLNNNRSKKLLVHHCTLKNWEGRSEQEWKSVQSILSLLNSYGLNNYHFIHTTFDYGDIKHVVRDKEVIGFFTGVILRDPKYDSVSNVIISSNKEDVSRVSYYEKTEKKRFDIIKAISNRDVTYEYPIKHLSRTELIASLDEDILKETWFCRTPVNDLPCNKCKTCKQVKKSFLELNRGLR